MDTNQKLPVVLLGLILFGFAGAIITEAFTMGNSYGYGPNVFYGALGFLLLGAALYCIISAAQPNSAEIPST